MYFVLGQQIIFSILFFATITISNGWSRTRCGTQSDPTADLITEWGLQVSPDNVLPEYPRPQMLRLNNWMNLNGLWNFQGSANHSNSNSNFKAAHTHGSVVALSDTILVPFPPESCLSGVHQTYQYLEYQLNFSDFEDRNKSDTRVLLHFGAIDWQSNITLNNQLLGSHTGGYDSFSIDITSALTDTNNNLYVSVYDPSDLGSQPNGKQEIAAFYGPVSNGNKYTPSSGIWQTVWMEYVPLQSYITGIQINPTLTNVSVNVSTFSANTNSNSELCQIDVFDPELNAIVSSIIGATNALLTLPNITNPKLWSPQSPFLYNLYVRLLSDSDRDAYTDMDGVNEGNDYIESYFGLRTITLQEYANPKNGNELDVRPALNGEPLFMVGWLDQSFWPDGIYVAPTDSALKFDLQAIKAYGLNAVRVHQKVNPERWYYHADVLGILVEQDMVQVRENANANPALSIEYFKADLSAMITGKYNHPSIIQWEIWNENDCWRVFPNVSEIVDLVSGLDASRLIDVDSGGKLNTTDLGDVFDVHDYPYPNQINPKPSMNQYAMIGEYGGIGYFDAGHEWVEHGCHAYMDVETAADFVSVYVNMSHMVLQQKGDLSSVVYTQITDVEQECDGFINYDRTSKFTKAQTQKIVNANQNMIHNMWT